MEKKLVCSKLLKNGVMFQKRTANYKKFTCYYKNRIIKFPYTKKEILSIQNIYDTLKEWNTSNISSPINYFEVNNDLDVKGEYAVEYSNLGEHSVEKCEVYINKESFSNYSYKVLERSNLLKLGDVMRENCKTTFSAETSIKHILNQITDITITLCKVRLAGVKDMGTSNILINMKNQKIYVIDFDQAGDETLHDSEIFYFQDKLHANIKKIWLYYVDNRKVIENLRKNVKSRLLNKAIELLSTEKIERTEVERTETEEIVEKSSAIAKPLSTMSYSFRHSVTRNGFSLDEIKSGLQKYIRRGKTMKALRCAFEIYAFKEIEEAKGVITNLYNRLATIAAEDIGPANCDLVYTVIRKIFKNDLNEDDLVSIVCEMSHSYKTRVLSHVNRTYGFTPDKAIKAIEVKNWNWRESDDENIRKCGNMFYHRLKEESLTAFYWLNQFIEKFKNVKIERLNRRTNSIEIIWEIIKPYIDEKVHDVLRNFYYRSSKDAPIFLKFVIFMIIENKKAKRLKLTEYEIPKGLVEGQYNLILDDYVIDKHTAKGRHSGKNRNDFVNEGAFITNRCPEYDAEKWLKLEAKYKE